MLDVVYSQVSCERLVVSCYVQRWAGCNLGYCLVFS